ncbi:MAG: menB [Actinomycetia bacterium]|nr:menB [Actinomycetes bacterium]
MGTAPQVSYDVDDGIGWITLRRPDTMNALDESVLRELFDVLLRANSDAATGVLFLTGEGPHFTAGGNVEWEAEFSADRTPDILRLVGHISYELRNAPKPILGAIRGYCIGGGNELNLHLDATIASETAKFAQTETRWGILPFWYTPQLLPLMVGERRAREILLFGRMYDADEALDMGLCNMVVPDDELEREVTAWARELLERSPTALRLVKMALNGIGDQLRGLANHESAIVSVTAGSERYRTELMSFYDVQGTRRPHPARPRRTYSSEH